MKTAENSSSEKQVFEAFSDALGLAIEENLRFRSPNRMQKKRSPKPKANDQ